MIRFLRRRGARYRRSRLDRLGDGVLSIYRLPVRWGEHPPGAGGADAGGRAAG